MSSGKLLAISLVLLIILVMVILVAYSVIPLMQRTTLTHRITSNSTLTTTAHSTTTMTLTQTATTQTTVTVVKNSTSTTTTTTSLLPAIDPRLIKANAYFLTTPYDMMSWNNSYFTQFVNYLVKANITYLYFNLPNINPNASLFDNFTLDSNLIIRFDMVGTNMSHQFQYVGWTGTQADPNATLGNFTTTGIDQTVSSLYKAGFDGILIDLEPVPNDSPQFLTMLQDFRDAINKFAPGMILGANTMAVYGGIEPGHEWAWDPNYYHTVSQLVNFVSPMLFESGKTSFNDYLQYVELQVQTTSQFSASPIIYAIPNWYTNSTYHNPKVENITSAILAFRAYLNNQKAPPLMIGLGIFGLNKTYILTPSTATQALETTPSDWSFFINQWVNTNYPTEIGSGFK
jgi:hypothetical protein